MSDPRVIGRVSPSPFIRSRLEQSALRSPSPVALGRLSSLSPSSHPLDRVEEVLGGIAGPGAASEHVVDPLPAAVRDLAVDPVALAAAHHLAQKVIQADRAWLRPGRIAG